MIKVEKKNCSGCTACASICPRGAITMVADEEGFLYPKVEEAKCTYCGLCDKVCAFHEQEQHENYPFAYAAKVKDNQVRHESATAGMFTVLSDAILEQNGVVYGVTFEDGFVAKHRRAETVEERNLMRGSKYVQSTMDGIFHGVKKDLQQGRMVLFTGTPCQVAGLKSYIQASCGINAEKLLAQLVLCDIICHGAPSPGIFKDWISYIEKKGKSKVRALSFRDKDFGWTRQAWKISLQNGRQYIDNIWIQYYKHWMYSHYILRPSCHNCCFTNLNRPGDITLGDFWNINQAAPDMKDELGVASILVHSKKGKILTEQILAACEWREISIEDCMQEQLRKPTQPAADREQFWTVYKQDGMAGIVKEYAGLSTLGKVKKQIKDLLGKS